MIEGCRGKVIFFVINKETGNYNNHVLHDISSNFSRCILEVRMPAPPKKFSPPVRGVCHSTALDENFQTVSEYEVKMILSGH